ncbi:MAG: carboxypeptidase regulatory-like domain-containing protein [Methylobacter sp.]|uniref:carboxypeptidase regulatory-like domain-containing protein n=1 Tax=Methylobacter sp. TaxID=2051955 RepID=UPI002731784B|nr:carboxypeptidase regulatory-like domain-containing protein [Methylobacter sp.]MDP1665903.1 carboxypeptidase regulatory-like domain-containing protein [Methylobacter sp.]
MKRLYLALIFLCILSSFSVGAEEFIIKPQTQGEVTFVTGGVGENERNAMQAMRAEYNLNLLFSVRDTGEYLSDVTVRITDSRGNTLMESVSDGPMLFAKLKPGRYIISADRGDGQVIHKKVMVKQRTALSFTWPQEQGN